MRHFKVFACAMALGLACALPAAGETASGDSAAGYAPAEPAASDAGTAIGGTSGSGGQGAGADLRSEAGRTASAGLDAVRPESAGGHDWNWLALPVLLGLIGLAALRGRHELARQRREGRRFV